MISLPLFYLFSGLTLGCSLFVILLRNPVSSAMAMVGCFIGLAALLIGINAYLIGILTILVYAGAIMVLFLFIIMVLDLKPSQNHLKPQVLIINLCLVVALFTSCLFILNFLPNEKAPELNLLQSATHFPKGTHIHQNLLENQLPDAHLIGQELFTQFAFPLQMIGVLLLIATIGIISLCRNES